MILQGRRFGPYTLERRIGKGGMGDVWLGIHDRLRRPAAVKVILQERLQGRDPDEVIRRFEREAEATASLSSPHTVKLYDFGLTDDGIFFHVMELLDGMPLSDLMRQSGELPVSRAIRFLRQACESLGEAHSQGLVHRDIKPANLFICTVGLRRDFLKVLDFGLVLHASDENDLLHPDSRVIVGTPGYIAPEVVQGDRAESASFDVYALGAIAHQMITGEKVFTGRTTRDVLEKHVLETPRRLDVLRPDVPKDFADVVMQCLRKEPDRRPGDALVLDDLLSRCADADAWTDARAERWWQGHVSGPRPVLSDDEAPTVAEPPISRSQGSRPQRKSLVVLPFENRSRDENDALFSDGLAEDVIVELSKIEALTVISRNSSFVNRTLSPRDACREFRVEYAVEGSVRRVGNRVRVNAQLVDGESGECVWAERFDREMLDLFQVQDELVSAVVSALSLRLTAGDEGRRGVQGTDSLEALEATLRGREEVIKQNRASLDQGREFLQKAIDLDPGFARPYGILAAMYILEFFDGKREDPMLCLSRAEHLGQSAVARDPNNSEGIIALGFHALITGRHDDAIRYATRLIQLDQAWGHGLMANVLHYVGRDTEALEHVKRVMRVDPLFPDMTLLWLGLVRFGLGHYEDARDAFLERTRRNPSHDLTYMLLASTFGQLGEGGLARAAWSRCLELSPSYSMAHRKSVVPYKGTDTFERFAEGLRMAGIKTDLD